MLLSAHPFRPRRFLGKTARRDNRAVGPARPARTAMRRRIRIPERTLLGAAMSVALVIAERRLNRMQAARNA